MQIFDIKHNTPRGTEDFADAPAWYELRSEVAAVAMWCYVAAKRKIGVKKGERLRSVQ